VTRTQDDEETIVREGFADKVRRTLGKVPFTREAVAAYYCAIDPTTPKQVKLAVFGALAYFVMPIDAVPDIIALLGFTDDAAIFWAAWRTIKPHVSDVHRSRAKAFLKHPDAEIDAPFHDKED